MLSLVGAAVGAQSAERLCLPRLQKTEHAGWQSEGGSSGWGGVGSGEWEVGLGGGGGGDSPCLSTQGTKGREREEVEEETQQGGSLLIRGREGGGCS